MKAPRPPLPVPMQSAVVRLLASGRVRSMILPVGEFGRLRPQDLLWVCEPIWIEERQRGRGELSLRYAGMSRPVAIAWPEVLARPHAGRRGARGMPLEASRYTLRVLEVEERRLYGLSHGEALECGAEPVDGGWCPPTAETDGFMPYEAPCEALAHVWDQDHGAGAARGNPEVILVRFQAIARNIAKVAPGMGSGGARR